VTVTIYPVPAITIGAPLAPTGASVQTGLDANTLDKQGPAPETARATHIVGNPAGDFAGLNPLELALDPSTGVTMQVALPGTSIVTVTNPTPVTVFPAVQAVLPTALAPNQALESLGNLALILEFLKNILVELRLANYQTLVSSGITDEQETFRSDTTVTTAVTNT
jgi:hypothetical protein